MTASYGRMLVPLPPPLDLPASLEPFRRWGDDLLDRWDGTRLLRTAAVDRRTIAYRAEPRGRLEAPALEVVRGDGTVNSSALARAVVASIVVAPPSWADLLARDPVLADLDGRYPGLRPVLVTDLFTALVRSISAQQVNLRWAATTRRRLAEAFGEQHGVAGEEVRALTPERLADASPDAIRALQFTNAKARSIIGVAKAFADRTIDPELLRQASDGDVIAALTALPGIGRWSADWFLARTLGRAVVVAGDLGVRKAVGRLYLGVPIASEDEVRRTTAHWGESAAVAQTLALRSLVG